MIDFGFGFVLKILGRIICFFRLLYMYSLERLVVVLYIEYFI